jgi:hypothetical protein
MPPGFLLTGLKVETRAGSGKVVTDLFWMTTPHFYKSGKLLVLCMWAMIRLSLGRCRPPWARSSPEADALQIGRIADKEPLAGLS